MTTEAKQESDTPLSKLVRQGSSLISYTIGQIADLERQLSAVTAERDALRVDAERYESLLKRCATALETTPTKWRNGEHITLPSRIKAAIDAARAK